MNVKQLLDKGRGTHRYLDVFSVAWDQKKKKNSAGGGHQGRRPFRKAATDAMGEAVIGQTPSDAVCPPSWEDGPAFSSNNRSGTF